MGDDGHPPTPIAGFSRMRALVAPANDWLSLAAAALRLIFADQATPYSRGLLQPPGDLSVPTRADMAANLPCNCCSK